MPNQFDQYEEENNEIYAPLLSALNSGVENYLGFMEHYLIKQQSHIITVGRHKEEDISYIVNASCYILINHLNQYRYDAEIKPEHINFLERLLTLLQEAKQTRLGDFLNPFFEKRSPKGDTEICLPSHYENIVQLVKSYRARCKEQSPYFSDNNNRRLKKKIVAYPPLWADVLGYGCNEQFRQKAIREKNEKIQEYTTNLFKYIRQLSSGLPEGEYNGFNLAGKVKIQTISNPSQLQGEDLTKSFAFFVEAKKRNPEVIGRKILLALPSDMRLQVNKTVIDLLPNKYAGSFFGQRLLSKLHEFFPDNIRSKNVPNAIARLISYLTIESDRNHYQLVNLLGNVGSKKVLEILTTLAKLYPDSGLKEEIDQRLALLFKHYGDYPENEVEWLIRLLEHYNMATAILFSQMDIAGLEELIKRDKKK